MTRTTHPFDHFMLGAFLGLVSVFFGAGCRQAVEMAREGKCSPADLAAIESAYVREAVTTCKAEGAKTVTRCRALPAIKAKYAREREAWVECAQ